MIDLNSVTLDGGSMHHVGSLTSITIEGSVSFRQLNSIVIAIPWSLEHLVAQSFTRVARVFTVSLFKKYDTGEISEIYTFLFFFSFHFVGVIVYVQVSSKHLSWIWSR